jgi:hypothetical protein
MCTQGVLQALVDFLGQEASSESISVTSNYPLISRVIDTICKLIYQNKETQQAFRELEGYQVMVQAFDRLFEDETMEASLQVEYA